MSSLSSSGLEKLTFKCLMWVNFSQKWLFHLSLKSHNFKTMIASPILKKAKSPQFYGLKKASKRNKCSDAPFWSFFGAFRFNVNFFKKKLNFRRKYLHTFTRYQNSQPHRWKALSILYLQWQGFEGFRVTVFKRNVEKHKKTRFSHFHLKLRPLANYDPWLNFTN